MATQKIHDEHVRLDSGDYYCPEYSNISSMLEDGKCPWCGYEYS